MSAAATRRNDWRARHHAGYWAFLLHRLSGLALALFLPLHFWLLGHALEGAAAFDAQLRFTELPLVKLAEWGLVVALTLHLMAGARILAIEFLPWSGVRKNWIAAAFGAALLAGAAFALALGPWS
jgi:fumarate reductase subunit D